MTEEQMRRALELCQRGRALRKQYDTFVLLKREYTTPKEVIYVGEPSRVKGDYFGTEVAIPDEARRHVFNLWKRDIALKHNAIVRELNQLGMTHDLTKIEVGSAAA